MRPALVDSFGRIHRSLRLSVTDRCNFRCPYCMPAKDVIFQPRAELLTYEEFERLVHVGVRLGIREVRITGGEPLVRRDLPRLVHLLAGLIFMGDDRVVQSAYIAGREVSVRRA